MDSLKRLHEKTLAMYKCIPEGHKQEVAAEFGASYTYFHRAVVNGTVKSAEAHHRAQAAMKTVAQRIYDNSKKLLNDLATVEAGDLEVIIDG